MIGVSSAFRLSKGGYLVDKRVLHRLKSILSFFSFKNPLLVDATHSIPTKSTMSVSTDFLISWIRDTMRQATSTLDMGHLVRSSVTGEDIENGRIDFYAVKPPHILEAARLVQAHNHERLNKLVSFIHTMNRSSNISHSTLLEMYNTIVRDGILTTHITTTNLRNIIAMFALLHQNRYTMHYLNAASHVLTDWTDDPKQLSAIYEALEWLKNQFETLLPIDTTKGGLQRVPHEHWKKPLSIIQQCLLTGPMNNNNNQQYQVANLTHIQELRQQWKNLNSQLLEQTMKPRPFSTYDKDKLLDLMCNILGVQQSIAKSMGYTSFAEMNLIQSSSMAARMGGIHAIQKLHSEIVAILNHHDGIHRSMDLQVIEDRVYFCDFHTVIKVLFELCNNLFQVKCEIIENDPLLPPSYFDRGTNVFVIHLYDGNSTTNNKTLLGSIVLDPMQRRSKVPGEFTIPIINNRFLSEEKILTDKSPLFTFVSLNISNELNDGNSIRMTMDDVQALFHEFGHALEIILRRTREEIHLLPIEHDGSEMVSQFMEYWLYDERLLPKIVTMKDGTTVQEKSEILTRIIENRSRRKLHELFHRILLSELELYLHGPGKSASTKGTDFIGTSNLENILQSTKRIFLSTAALDNVKEDIEFLIHIFENNAKGKQTLQYRYLWSEIMSADCFNAFSTKDLPLNELGELGGRFRRHILERRKGFNGDVDNDNCDMNMAFRLFRGRDATSTAFMSYILPQKGTRKQCGQQRAIEKGIQSVSHRRKRR